MNKTHTVIIGAGLSGLYMALSIDQTIPVTLIVKTSLKESNSNLAQGGIAAEMTHEKNMLKHHIEDTLKAGSHLNDFEAVKVLVNEAHENIEKLLELNVKFDTDSEGRILTTKEGGHSTSRILHIGGDATGREIMNALQKAAKARKNITILSETMATDFLMYEDKIYGVQTLDRFGQSESFLAQNVVIASGGIGAIYGSTTNASIATGDGIAMVERAQGVVEKMEFIQFHPTAFYEFTTQQQKFLLSEALRGEGAILRNIEGEAFMEKYHEDKDLAPRDKVSQAIFREMYDTWSDYVLLDTTHLDKAYIQARFPTITKRLKEHGLTLGEDLIPTAPVEHFNIGGIKTDLHGKTSIEHVYALGECASTGVHGANRLASNSLLECVVFGRRIAKSLSQVKERDVSIPALEEDKATYQYNYAPLRKKLGQIMDEHVGIVRTKEGLLTAKSTVKDMHRSLIKHPNHAIKYYETLNMVTVASQIIKDALKRKESLGCHFRLN
jgi:L-aspartate oxidase